VTTATTPLKLVWGALPRSTGQHNATVTTSEELLQVLDRIHTDAINRDLAQRVDAWSGTWTIGGLGLPDPLVQFLVGNHHRASLRWFSGDDCYQATDPDLPLLPETILYDRGGTVDEMKPEETRTTLETVKHILTAYLDTGARPMDVAWTTL
jgi:hypothetical protein